MDAETARKLNSWNPFFMKCEVKGCTQPQKYRQELVIEELRFGTLAINDKIVQVYLCEKHYLDETTEADGQLL